jgi:integrase
MLRPHADVATPDQAARAGASADEANGSVVDYLDTHRGTKGGRRRYIPIDDELRRHAVDYARHVCKGPHASVSDQTLTLVQAMRRLRYVMERFGITKRDLHVVPHGLRHQFAGRGYTLNTGVLPPVAGGPVVDAALDVRARDTISQQLGHGRRQIVNAYLGRRQIDKPAGAPDGDHRLP